MSIIKDILEKAVSMDASDVHLKAGQPPFFRVQGDLVESGMGAMSADDLIRVSDDITPEHVRKKELVVHELDFAHFEEGVGRFRTNVFLSRHIPTISLRYVKTKIPSIAGLHLPPIIETIALSGSGIIFVVGPTSSGKSTTLAAMVNKRNATNRERIITIEDPVEYIFEDIKSVITQREVGLDTPSFHSALKHVLRQDPDVIIVGEMRDNTSLSVALSAAETGNVVFSTLHANTAAQSVQRILNFFQPQEREQVRMALASNMHAVICQRLIPAVKGGVRPAVEIMINTPTVRKLLQENRLETLQAAIETGREDGMQSFNQAIYDLIKSGAVTESDGMAHAPRPESLKMNLQGIFLDEGSRIIGE